MISNTNNIYNKARMQAMNETLSLHIADETIKIDIDSYLNKFYKRAGQTVLNNRSQKLNYFYKDLSKETKDLCDVAEEIKSSKLSKDDPSTAGSYAEDILIKTLENFFPNYRIKKGGHILWATDEISPQIDILLLSKDIPNHIIEKPKIPHEFVIAVFEIKLTLNSSNLKKSLDNSKKIKSISKGKTNLLKSKNIFYAILAFSEEFNNKNKHTENTILDAIKKNYSNLEQEQDLLPDSILILNQYCCILERWVDWDYISLENKEIDLFLCTNYITHCEGKPFYSPNNNALGYFIFHLSEFIYKVVKDNGVNNLNKFYSIIEIEGMMENEEIARTLLREYIPQSEVEDILNNKYQQNEFLIKINI